MPNATTPEPRRPRCPTCGGAPDAAYRPFCGRGCRDRDLLAWFDEGHRIPGTPIAQDEDES